MYGRKYVWIVPHWYENQFWNKISQNSNCQPENIHAVINHALSIRILYMNYKHAVTVSGFVSNKL